MTPFTVCEATARLALLCHQVAESLWGSLVGVPSGSGRLSIGPLPRLQPAGGGSRGTLWVARRLSTCPTTMALPGRDALCSAAILLLLAGRALAAGARPA